MHAFFAPSCGGTRFEAAQWSGAVERCRLRGGAVERRGNLNPRQVMAAVRSPVFRHAGAWRHAGNEIPEQNRTPEVVRSRATTPPGMLGCAMRGAWRHAGCRDCGYIKECVPKVRPLSPLHPSLTTIFIAIVDFLKNNCEKIWWIRQKAITLHSQSNARCHSSVGRAKD